MTPLPAHNPQTPAPPPPLSLVMDKVAWSWAVHALVGTGGLSVLKPLYPDRTGRPLEPPGRLCPTEPLKRD